MNRVQTWLVQLKNLIIVLRFEPAHNMNRRLTVQRRDSNSLNSASISRYAVEDDRIEEYAESLIQQEPV